MKTDNGARFSIYLRKNQLEWLDNEAEKMGVSRSKFIELKTFPKSLQGFHLQTFSLVFSYRIVMTNDTFRSKPSSSTLPPDALNANVSSSSISAKRYSPAPCPNRTGSRPERTRVSVAPSPTTNLIAGFPRLGAAPNAHSAVKEAPSGISTPLDAVSITFQDASVTDTRRPRSAA